MLSNMLREHPKVLSLSEFFSYLSDLGRRINVMFSDQPVDGRTFWAFAAEVTPHSNFTIRHRIAPPEIIYPWASPSARYSSETGIPAILMATLPHLTADHEALFDLLRDEVENWPTSTMKEHYGHLFGWLAQYFGKRLWVERSGAAFVMLDRMLAAFPDARFVHIVRDGRDAAISMGGQLDFRLHLVMSMIEQHLGVDPMDSPDRANVDRVPAQLRPFLPETFAAEPFRAFDPVPLSLYGEFWTQQMDMGLKALRSLPAQRVLSVRYEDFFVDAKSQLDALARYLGEEFIDEDWSARCAATVRRPKSTWRDLPEK
jgi:putative sulfotransferase